MKNPVLSIEQLTVESFTTSAANPEIGAGDVETGCVSDCVTGCGFGGSVC